MDIIYAAEKPSIAALLSECVKRPVELDDITVTENSGETGSFYIAWHSNHYVLAPNGEITLKTPQPLD